MFDQKLPQQITYQNILPKGFPSVFKQWQLDPMTSNKVWNNNDIVRFNFMNLGKGVFDPFRSFIQITVSCNSLNNPVGLLQIDNSAQSFINQSILYSNSKQIQRITQYSVLAAYLNDIGLNQMISEGRETQGLGYGSFDTMPYGRSVNTNHSSMRRVSNSTDYTGTFSTGNIFPTIGNFYPEQVQYLNMNSIMNCSRQAKGHITNSNVTMTGSDWNGGNNAYNSTGMQASLSFLGYGNNIRGQYQAKFIENKYPQHTQSIPCSQLQLNRNISNNKYPFYFNKDIPYMPIVRSTYVDSLYYDTYHNSNSHIINCANFGFSSLFSPFFTRGAFQPCISATLLQSMQNNGIITTTKTPIYRRKFKLPLISAVMGVLIDPSQFILIPLQSINNCLLQLTLDEYAMFTSGYNDVSEMDTQGMKYQQPRSYIIQRIQYKLQTYHFVDQKIQQYIQMSLVKQISIITNFWSLSNQFQIPGGTTPNNSYIVGCNATHLNQIVCLFYSNDYQSYTFARKHFRLSNNVTKFWSKIAVDYWPPQPFKGNGGNSFSNQIDDDNSVFVENIYWSGNYMFSKAALPRINVYNFSINQRPYNVTNKRTMYDTAMLNNQNYAFTSSSVNADTAMGMSWIHQNRVIGKAAYVITFTPFAQSQHVLHGINVSGISNFQVVFECNSKNTYPRDQTLYIFAKTSGVVKYGKNGIQTFGRG